MSLADGTLIGLHLETFQFPGCYEFVVCLHEYVGEVCIPYESHGQ